MNTQSVLRAPRRLRSALVLAVRPPAVVGTSAHAGTPSRIQKSTNTGSFLGKWGSAGIGNGQVTGPESVAVDGRGNVFVSDFNQRVQKFACPE